MDTLSESVITALRNAIQETFETLTFSEVSEWSTRKPDLSPAEPRIGSAIEIRTPIHARFTLLLNHSQCLEFVDTAYGPDVAESASESGILQDYINELVNTIAGRFAASLVQNNGQLLLGLPHAIDDTQPTPQNLFAFTIDGITSLCSLVLVT